MTSRIRAPRRRAWSSARRPDATLSLSDDHRAWVVDNILRGVPPVEVIRALRDGGVPEAIAFAEVAAIIASPALDACRRREGRARQLQLVADLLRTHARLAPAPGRVERHETLSADAFYDRFFAASRPVILTRALEAWPALRRWTPAYLADRFGDVEVEIMDGRDADPLCDERFEAHRRPIRLAAYVDRVLRAGRSNDSYLVAHNELLRRPELAPLFDDVRPDEAIFDPEALRHSSSFWFGPAGTVTPLHHDTTNILFCQIHGRKRVRLAAPWETALLRGARGFYAGVSCDDPRFREDPELREVVLADVTLSPGEALFIPAGWWHEVEALEVSINFSLLGFRRPNDVDWYRPAAARCGSEGG